MACRIHRLLLIPIGVAATCFTVPATDVMGQIFARAALVDPLAPEVEVENNVSCGLSSCPPQGLTFGYYHEHWRRWPEEPAMPFSADALSPFVRSPREVPSLQTPDITQEESLAPPRRGIGADQRQPDAPTPPAMPPSQPPTDAETDDELPAAESPSAEDTPSPLDEPRLPPADEDQGGFFPPADADVPDELPDALPDPDADLTLPPGNLEDPLGPERLDAQPPDDDAGDVFDLDDFSRTNPRRLQRYRLSSSRQLRRTRGHATTVRSPSHRAPAGRPPVQLAGYRRPPSGRANPLRAWVAEVDHQAWQSDMAPDDYAPETAQWHAEPADYEEYEPTPTPNRRSNPLR